MKKKQYEVILTHSQISRASIVITASSQEEAEEMADQIQADEIDNWNPIDGDVMVESVTKAYP